jgi:hypothetical protein
MMSFEITFCFSALLSSLFEGGKHHVPTQIIHSDLGCKIPTLAGLRSVRVPANVKQGALFKHLVLRALQGCFP